jgi:hypothetical protein
MPIKSFRGLIAQDGIDTITLHTNTGSTGYRLKKFELIPNNPGTETPESVVKIYKIPQTTATSEIDFSDNTMLAAGYYAGENTPNFPQDVVVIFDNEIFNQDIYITHKNDSEAKAMNYYIEIEQIKLDLTENTVATLKDIRNIEQPSVV